MQHRATKMVTEFNWMDYNIKIGDNDTRRKRSDLIQIFKIVKGLEEVEVDWNKNLNRISPVLSHMHHIVIENKV